MELENALPRHVLGSLIPSEFFQSSAKFPPKILPSSTIRGSRSSGFVISGGFLRSRLRGFERGQLYASASDTLYHRHLYVSAFFLFIERRSVSRRGIFRGLNLEESPDEDDDSLFRAAHLPPGKGGFFLPRFLPATTAEILKNLGIGRGDGYWVCNVSLWMNCKSSR